VKQKLKEGFNGAAPGGAENLLNSYPLTSNLASGHLREGVALLGGGVLSCLLGLWQVVL